MKLIFKHMLGIFLGLLPFHLHSVEYTIRDLGTLKFEESQALGINNQNVVVLTQKDVRNVSGFTWDLNRGLTPLPHPLYNLSFVMNNHN